MMNTIIDTDELMFLRTVPCFRDLSITELIQVHWSADRHELHAGEIIVRTGDPTDALYVVRRGHVRLFVTTVGGTERVLADQGPGTTFNEAAVCDGGPAAVTAQSLSAGTCIDEVPATLVSRLWERHPHLLVHSVQAVARHIRRMAALLDDRSCAGSVH